MFVLDKQRRITGQFPADKKGVHPRLYLTPARVATLQARWAAVVAAQNSNPSTMWINEWKQITTLANGVKPLEAALHFVCSPTDTYSGTVGGVVLVNATFDRVALAAITAQMAAIIPNGNNSYPSLFEFLRQPHRCAIVYDWCYSSLGLINPLTGNTYKADLTGHMDRVVTLLDGTGKPGNTALPNPNSTLMWDQMNDINGHTMNGATHGNMLAWGIACYDEDSRWFDSLMPLLRGRFRDVHDWLAGNCALGFSHYYTWFSHQACAHMMMDALGMPKWMPDAMKRAPLQLLYDLRPDGRAMKLGDMVDDDFFDSQYRTQCALWGHVWQTDPVYGPLYSYMANTDWVAQPIGTKTNRNGGTMKSILWREQVDEGVCAFMFAVLDDADKTSAWARSAGPHPDLTALPKAHYFGSPAHYAVLRSSWAMGSPGSNTSVLIRMNGGKTAWGGHQQLNQGTFSLYFKGPLTGDMGVYQASRSVFLSAYHIEFLGGSSSKNALFLRHPAELNYVIANIFADGGISQPQPYRGTIPDPAPGLTARQLFERSNSKQPARLSEVLADYGINGYDRAVPVVGWTNAAGTAAYVSTDLTRGYNTLQCQRADAVKQRQLAVATGDAGFPAVLFLAEYMAPKAGVASQGWWVQTVHTPTIDNVVQTAFWQNNVRPGTTSPLCDEDATRSAEDYFYYYRGPDYVGSYGGRLTLHSLLPTGQAMTFLAYPDSTPGTAENPGAAPTLFGLLKKGRVRKPDGTYSDRDPGDKGQNQASGDAFPNGEDGFGRVELIIDDTVARDYLRVLVPTDAGVASPAVTKYDSANWMGARVGNVVAMFGKGGVDIAAGNAESVTVAGANYTLFAAVDPGTWLIRTNGTLRATITVTAEERILQVDNLPAGALTIRTA